MPTVTRSAGPSDCMKARTVSDHVTSLRQSADDSTNLAKLRIQYEGSSKPTSVIETNKKGLLGALMDSESKVIEDSTEGSPFQPPKEELMYKKQTKRKIIIKKRDEPLSKKCSLEIVEDVPSTVKSNHLHTAESYVAEVKRSLSTEKYKLFSKALVEYKKNGDFQKLTPVLVGIFTEDCACYPLFREFYRFVRHKDKREYDELCKNLTGVGCGYKPEDSITKKRLHSDQQCSTEKRQKTNTFGILSENISSSDKNTNQHLNEIRNVTNENEQSGTVLDPNAGQKLLSSTDKQEILNNSSGDLFEDADSSKRLANYENDVLKASEIKCSSKQPSGYFCCNCQKDAERPFEAACGHICCFRCWRTVFDTNKVCPVCNERVRRRHLKCLYFAGLGVD